MRKKRILKGAWSEAKRTAYGVHAMNARTSISYAFTVTEDRNSVKHGEFIYGNEPVSFEHFDGFISFATGKCVELQPGEVIQ